MHYPYFYKFENREGGIKYDEISDSYIVWIRENPSAKYTDLIPVYSNGVDARKRLDDELLK